MNTAIPLSDSLISFLWINSSSKYNPEGNLLENTFVQKGQEIKDPLTKSSQQDRQRDQTILVWFPELKLSRLYRPDQTQGKASQNSYTHFGQMEEICQKCRKNQKIDG